MSRRAKAAPRGGASARLVMSLLALIAILARSVRAVKKQIMMMKKRLLDALKQQQSGNWPSERR
jgi:hypothetical protein